MRSSSAPEESIAVVGISFTMPQGIDNDSSLWETLEAKKNVMTEWPANRAHVEGFTDTSVPKKPNVVSFPTA